MSYLYNYFKVADSEEFLENSQADSVYFPYSDLMVFLTPSCYFLHITSW